MKTKCIVLGEKQEVKKEFKPIEFVYAIHALCGKPSFEQTTTKPNEFENVELIKKSSFSDIYDTMFTYDEYRSNGFTYLGHWNDGVTTKQG